MGRKGGSAAEVRRRAKQDLLKLSKSFGVEHGKVRLIGVFSLQHGYTTQRIEEYLDELVDVGLIEIHGDTILVPDTAQDTGTDKEAMNEEAPGK